MIVFKQCKICNEIRLTPDETSYVCGDCLCKLIYRRGGNLFNMLGFIHSDENYTVAKKILMINGQ